MQYHPIRMAHKYLVHVGSPALKMADTFSIASGGVVLTEIRESDKEAYRKLNTDVQNNRYWGYDYREDVSITGPVDENTFFDAVTYDTAAGDSINFAVRLTEDGEMIGEAVLWNFTSDGTAELGCRIMPACQGKGFGRATFGAVADFASRNLNLRVTARCCRENTPSARMIAACGFVPLRQDEKFCYYEKRVD
jgi:RimJ/RimL family protein N-acetyltransferase